MGRDGVRRGIHRVARPGHACLEFAQQNRMSVALNRTWEGGTSVQVGYLRQVLIEGSGLEAERNHVLLVGLRHNLDFRD